MLKIVNSYSLSFCVSSSLVPSPLLHTGIFKSEKKKKKNVETVEQETMWKWKKINAQQKCLRWTSAMTWTCLSPSKTCRVWRAKWRRGDERDQLKLQRSQTGLCRAIPDASSRLCTGQQRRQPCQARIWLLYIILCDLYCSEFFNHYWRIRGQKWDLLRSSIMCIIYFIHFKKNK